MRGSTLGALMVSAALLEAWPLRAQSPEPSGFHLSGALGQSGEVPATSALAGAIPVPALSSGNVEEKTGKPSFIAVPLPNSNPTLGTGLGAAGILFFRPSKKDAVSPSSTLGVGGMYFDTKSWALAAGGRVILKEDRWRITAALAAADFRYDLYGKGVEESSSGALVGVRQKMTGGMAQVQLRLFGRIYGGLRYVLSDVTTALTNPASPLPPGVGEGELALRVGALGPVVSLDSRDNQFFLLRGWAVDLRTDFYAGSFGGQSSFQKYEVNVRGYFPVREVDALATQLYVCSVGSQAPFFLQCLYGSAGVLRGYPVGKYYDQTM
ncbi:MAG TPA: BamA/TamA family outer membrane protein, partial [Myxococcaceae bacterium]|nr:BamA/TamA family outer membrane protein [Myxococcaceae bacterium]